MPSARTSLGRGGRPSRDDHDQVRVILIGGTSHVGKSHLTESLAVRLAWKCVSTDQLARHPGRPWRPAPQAVPDHVAEHYLSLSVDELIEDVLRHYRSMWPGIEAMVTTHATDVSTGCLVLEGSALWPESVATLDVDNVAAIWLTAGDELFRTRICSDSGFEGASDRNRAMIQQFLRRTLRYNANMMAAIGRLGLVSVNVEDSASPRQLRNDCLRLLQAGGRSGASASMAGSPRR